MPGICSIFSGGAVAGGVSALPEELTVSALPEAPVTEEIIPMRLLKSEPLSSENIDVSSLGDVMKL
jgi:hypothetical protein